jgi:hypothetical protein
MMSPVVSVPVNWVKPALGKPPGTVALLLVMVNPIAPAPVLFKPNAG